MTKITRSLIGSAALTAAIWLVQMPLQPPPASAAETDGGCGSDCEGGGDGEGSSSGAQQQAPPVVTGADSSGASIGDLAKQRFNQMITHRVLGTVLLGVNEQVNCHDCISAFGSAGSFSAGWAGAISAGASLRSPGIDATGENVPPRFGGDHLRGSSKKDSDFAALFFLQGFSGTGTGESPGGFVFS